MTNAIKSVSLEEYCGLVRNAVDTAMERANAYGWVEYTYEDHVILNFGGVFYRANYEDDTDGSITVAPATEWTRVEREWMAPGTKNRGTIKSAPKAVKATGDYTLRGYGVVFGGKDLLGDTFSKDTDYGADRSFVGMPVYYDHAMGGLKSQIGTVKAYEFADDGLIFEIEIDRRKKYADTVMQLANDQALGQSTGAVAHLVYAEKGEMKRWLIGEVSVTPIPAEPRTNADPLKYLLSQTDQQALGESANDTVTTDDEYYILD